MIRFAVIIIFTCYVISFCNCGNITIKLCALIPVTPGHFSSSGKQWEAVALAATSAINDQNMIAGNKLEMIILDTLDTSPGTANASFQVINQNCVGTIDATTAILSELAQNILQNYKIPQISALSASTGLSDKTLFPTFLRITPSHADGGPVMAYLVKTFGWKRVAIISSMDAYGISYYQSFKEALDPQIEISAECFIDPFQPDYSDQVNNLANAYTAIIVILALVPDMEKILLEAYRQQILRAPYVWIGPSAMANLNHSILPEGALLGSLCVTPSSITDTPLAAQYIEAAKRLNVTHHHGGFVYDAVYAFASAFQKIGSWEDPETLLETLKNISFTGVSGLIRFDTHGDRMGYLYEVQNWDQNDTARKVASISWNSTVSMELKIVWSDGTFNIPKDSIIQMISIPKAVRYPCFLVALSLLIIEVALLLIYLQKSKMTQRRAIVKKGLFLIGNLMGYSAVAIILFLGVTETNCFLVPILLDFSFLFCGGTISFIVTQQLIRYYQDMAMNPRYRTASVRLFLNSVWFLLMLFNVLSLIMVFLIHDPPVVARKWLKHDDYENRCKFHLSYVLLPVSIGSIYLYALIVKLAGIVINSSVLAKQNSNFFTTTNILLTFLDIAVGLVFVVVIQPNQTNQIIIIFVAVAINGLSAPLNLFRNIRRKKQRGDYEPVPPLHAFNDAPSYSNFGDVTINELNS